MRSDARIADDIDLTSMRDVLQRSGLKLVAAACGVGLLTFAALSLVTPKYASEAQILIGGQGLNERLRDPQLGAGSHADSMAGKVDKEAVASQVVALRSRDLASKVAAELKLAGRPEFNSAVAEPGLMGAALRALGLTGPRAGESEEERVLEAYFKALRVFQGKDTRVISIEFTSIDSELAATAANRLAESYQDWLRAQGVSQTTDASEWLKPQIDKLASEVNAAEAEAERFRSQANLFRGSAQSGGLNEQQLGEFSSEVTRARTARGEAEARARSARDLMQRGNAEAIPDVQKSPIIQSLVAQRVRAEREKAEAEAMLLPAHPRMKQLNANVTDLRRQVAREASTIVEGLEKEAAVVALREEMARKSLDEIKGRVGDKAVDMAKLAGLESQAKAKRRELETLQASFEAARSRGEAKAIPLDAQIISTARPSAIPASPKKLQSALLAAAATLVLGVVLVFTRELLNAGRKAATPTAELHSLAVVRRHKLRSVATASVATEPAAMSPSTNSDSGSTENREFASAAAVAADLRQRPPHHGACVVFVTGAEESIDVRPEAAQLAHSLTSAGLEVVLMDWNRDRKADAAFPEPGSAAGIMDLLHGDAVFEEVIQHMPGSNAHYVAYSADAGHERPLNGEQINLVFDALDEAYDYIIVTGPHDEIKELTDLVEARLDVGVLVVERAEQTAADQRASLAFGQGTPRAEVLILTRGAAATRATAKQKPLSTADALA